jgi:tRNA(Ile)-lysidine synthetase, N-terminal domain
MAAAVVRRFTNPGGMTEALLTAVKSRLSRLCPDWEKARFLAAFSGGLDSTALVHLLAALLPTEQLGTAHLNHCLRGPDSEADQNFAGETAAALGLTFISERRDVAALAQERRKGLEEAARRARYDFLLQAAEKFRADYILTAHQADDQAETMLMNFLKGSGGGGLAGIHPRRSLKSETYQVEIVRPLLPFSRDELGRWLSDRGLAWVEDRSNQDEHYLRNALRLNVFPQLKKLNPRLGQALGRTAEILRAEEDFWRAHLETLWPKIARQEGPDLIHLARPALAGLSLAEQRRLIYEALSRIWRGLSPNEPLSLAGVDMVLEMLGREGHKGLDLPGGLRAELSPASLRLSPASRLAKTGLAP